MDVVHLDGSGKQRGNLGRREASDAAADTGDEEGHLRMLCGKSDEVLHVGQDGVNAALHGGNGVALSLQAHTLTYDGAALSLLTEGDSVEMIFEKEN